MYPCFRKTVQPGDAIIDVGTGSGVLSIAAAKLGASSVQAYDLDPVAVESAEMNVRLNKTDDIVSVGQNSLLEGIEGPVDLIVANLLAEIILLFPEDAKKSCEVRWIIYYIGHYSLRRKK